MTDLLIDPGKATKPQSKRRERDAYFTPQWATAALLAAFPEIRGGVLLDPCCGDGRMARALAPRFRQVLLNDIEPVGDQHLVEPTRLDATRVELFTQSQADWIVSNLPFCLSGPMAWQCVRGARAGAALLLRATFLEPCEGREWLTRNPPTAILATPRISFNGGAGTDSAGCWWFIWGPVSPGIRVVRGDEHAQLALGVGP